MDYPSQGQIISWSMLILWFLWLAALSVKYFFAILKPNSSYNKNFIKNCSITSFFNVVFCSPIAFLTIVWGINNGIESGAYLIAFSIIFAPIIALFIGGAVGKYGYNKVGLSIAYLPYFFELVIILLIIIRALGLSDNFVYYIIQWVAFQL